MPKPSKVPYPGHGKSTPDNNGLLWLSSISESEKSEVFNLIKTGEGSVLKRAWLGLAEPYKYPNYGKQYENAELWCYNYFHTSHDDATKHATFRLFEDAESKPWNGRTYHLYKDGTVKSWTNEKWEAEERPEAQN